MNTEVTKAVEVYREILRGLDEETCHLLANAYKRMHEALIRVGFNREEAMRIITETGGIKFNSQ